MCGQKKKEEEKQVVAGRTAMVSGEDIGRKQWQA